MSELKPNMSTIKDSRGKIRHIEHVDEPFLSPSLEEPSPEQLADQYVSAVAPIYEIGTDLVSDLSAPVPCSVTKEESKLHRRKVKEIAGSIVVDYVESYNGLPIWRADFSVHIAPNPMRVTSSTSSLPDKVELGNAPNKVSRSLNKLKPKFLNKLMGLNDLEGVTKINGTRLVVYQYSAEDRTEAQTIPGEKQVSFETAAPTLPLPPVPDSVVSGKHYVVAEVLFDINLRQWKDIHWLALVEPTLETVLYLRALVSPATGSVFKMDPISQTGNTALIPSASEPSLNPARSSASIDNLVSASPQGLQGTQTAIQEVEAPTQSGPTTAPPNAFDYGTKTTDFAAVNAYYHVNWFFNLIKGMGFSLSSYFDNTTFPVLVDHWSLGGSTNVNAHCAGNSSGNGVGHFCFASAQAGQTVGIAADVKVVIHEFGHALLWDHVSSPNFGFAHSAGDALAAILMDPTNKAPDRYLTFPWPQVGTPPNNTPLDRRHDRKVVDGWGWFGSKYNTQYNGEQVLSTTLFRLYRAVGGDSPFLPDRQWASRYVSYLIIKAIGLLTNTTNDPRVFATALMNADLTTVNFEGHPGGALHKVVRWAFEKQGLYQANASPGTTTPVTKEGDPPDVDVYIDRGTNGEYPYNFAFWECQDIWVRRSPDGGTVHQNPALGKPNYMYVKVKNRGKQTATNVVVKAYHCNPGSGLVWPSDWGPMDTPQLSAPSNILPGGEVTVGPFEWTPTVYMHECILAVASATGDLANDTTVQGALPHSRFVPFDNNIGQRNVHPVYVINIAKILEYLRKLRFVVVNPYNKAVKVELVAVLPKLFVERKYWVFFSNAGGKKFELGPRETKEVVAAVVKEPMISRRHPWIATTTVSKPGVAMPEEILRDDKSMTLEELSLEKPIKFWIVTLIDGQNMGGMTYILQSKKALPVPERPFGVTEEMELSEVENLTILIERMKEQQGVKSVKICKITFDVELAEIEMALED